MAFWTVLSWAECKILQKKKSMKDVVFRKERCWLITPGDSADFSNLEGVSF